MLIEGLLQLKRRNVLAASPNAVLYAINKEQTTFGVHMAGIPSMEPKVPPRLNGLVRHFEIANVETKRHLRANQNFADLITR